MEIIQTVEQRCNTFYIRATNCDSRCEDFRRLKEWKSVEVGYERCDITSVSIDNLIEGRLYRLVVQRSPLKDKHGREQTDMFGVIYTYRCILTNNRMSTEKDIITFYNERGASEKYFDIQNNDFGWSHLPFSFMAEKHGFHDGYCHAEELLPRLSYQ